MNDEILVKELVRKYQESVHSQDKKLFDEIWANQVPCTLISIATEFSGKENIYQQFLVGAIQKNYQAIDLIAEQIKVNFINVNTVIIIFEYHTECIKRDTNEEYGISGIETQIAIKEDELWKLVHVHYSKR